MSAAAQGSASNGYSQVLALIRSGVAASRADVARLAGMSASTASSRIDVLIRRGLVREEGVGVSRGGRRPRRLQLESGLGTVAALDLRCDSATVALADLSGTVLRQEDLTLRLGDGPRVVVGELGRRLEELLDAGMPPLRASCIGVPGPVGPGRDVVVAAARMPGWNGVDVSRLAEERLGVPTIVENDANLAALGEHTLRPHLGDIAVVKVDAGIGCGIVVDGELYRGANGMAGDISHTTVPDAPPIPCSCGRTGCLDVVASGSAILGRLRDEGVGGDSISDALTAARDGHPLATNLLREAGERIGAVLGTVVSFFNPSALVLAGQVSMAPTFRSALTSTIYAACLPAMTAHLEILHGEDNGRASVDGATRLAVDAAFARGALATKLH